MVGGMVRVSERREKTMDIVFLLLIAIAGFCAFPVWRLVHARFGSPDILNLAIIGLVIAIVGLVWIDFVQL
jgi:hypothetical protein